MAVADVTEIQRDQELLLRILPMVKLAAELLDAPPALVERVLLVQPEVGPAMARASAELSEMHGCVTAAALRICAAALRTEEGAL